MGNSPSNTVRTMEHTASKLKNCFNIERIVVGSCDFIKTEGEYDNNIKVGILGNGDPENPLSNQAIKIGNSEPYRLVSFIESPDQLVYKFEKNVNFTLMKRRGSVVFHLETPELNVTKEVDPRITKLYKTIDMGSLEIDKIEKIYKME